MRALICKKFGLPKDLVLEEVSNPAPKNNQVIIDIHAAGINFPDMLMFAGKYQVKTPPPFIPGNEACGIISEIKNNTSRFSVGDKVFCSPMKGAFAEKIAINENHVFPLPKDLNFEQGAGFPIAFCTSYHALKDQASLKPGEKILILGAAGGVGTTAIQLSKAMGAHVIAAASSDEKLEFAKSMGADETINYSKSSLKEVVKDLTNGKGVDVVYDPVGGELAEAALRACGWKSRYLVIGFASGIIPKLPANLALLKESHIIGVFWGQWATLNPTLHLKNIQEIFKIFNTNHLAPHISDSYPISDFVIAYDDIANRRIKGKTVFKIR